MSLHNLHIYKRLNQKKKLSLYSKLDLARIKNYILSTLTFVKISTSACESLGADTYILITGLRECSGIIGIICVKLANTELQSSVKKYDN